MMNPKPFQRRIAIVLLAIFLPSLFPVNLLYASNNGPTAPEAASFEPVDATDMVNLATGDMNYVLPLLNVPSPEGGYPLVMSYHGGIAYDLESSWVGLGWNLNPGAIERGVNGYPDDWKEALIRTRNYYEFSATSVDIGVSVGIEEAVSIDIGVSYGWDSNGGKYGTVNLGVGTIDGGTDANTGISIGYHNKSGMIFNVSAGISENGVGIGGSVGTQGAAIGANYSFSMGDTPLNSTIGISLSTNGISGTYSLSMGQGASNFSINSGSLGELTETNMSFAIPLVVIPAWLKFGKRKIKYEKNETYANFVYGPLYYKDFNYQQGQGSSYSTELSNESNRDYFMDSYEQELPQIETEFISYEDIYENQKYAYTFPSYDSYIVNAQGLTGAMTPRLFENGTIIGKSQNFEQEDDEIVIPGSYPPVKGGVVLPPPTPLNYNLNPPVPGYNGGIFHFGVLPVTYKYRSLESFVMNWNYSSSSRKFTKSFGTSLDQNATNQMRFYFENSFPSNLSITPSTLTNGNANILDYIGSSNAAITNRQQNGNYVEAYTNKQLAKRSSNPSQAITSTTEMYAQTGVLVPFNGDQSYNRLAENGYSDEGIGAYKITTPDGKTYHYAMPVYQYEEVYRQLKKHPDHQEDNNPDNDFFSENRFYHEQRKSQPYATHWLLTAVTGPDYYDANNNGIADSEDYGYWTRFDYGKWTDGYCWRAPFKGFNDFDQFANYNKKENAREYGWGRKQLAYLNKVVTRTHTAIMVKSLRHDSMSKEIGNDVIDVNPLTGQQVFGYHSFEGDNGIYYPSQRTMKLDEIILLQNENDNVTAANQVQSITTNPSQTRTVNWNSPIVKNYNNTNNFVQYKINQQNLVIDNGDLPKDASGNYLLYQKAEKIIKLNQDYSLATNTPNSDAPANGGVASKGRLTLKSVQNLGRNAYNYMPPTTFDYFNNDLAYQECPNATCNIKNPWGYNNNMPQAWSLQRITTPTGAKLEFELEKDTYWTEAFSRRYWLEDLMFKGMAVGDDLIIEVKNKTGITSGTGVNFIEYFMANEKVFLDLIIWKRNRWWSGTNKREGKWKLDLLGDKICEVINVTSDKLTIKSPGNANLIDAEIGCNEGNNDCYFARGSNPIIGSHEFEPQNPREEGQPATPSPGIGNDASHHRMYYNLLANRIPGEGTGGGLRVKAISSIDEVNNRYTTEYNYNHPTKNRTSGITSFAPVRGLKYVPYQTELPAPRVMYEYVTVVEKTNNNGVIQKNGKIVYRFNVLENATNIFDKNISVGDYFKSEVTTNDNLNPTLKVKGAKIRLHDNTSQLGSIISVERYNNSNQLLSKTLTSRKSLNDLILSTANNSSKGAIQESFQSMKSIHQFNSNYVKAQAGLSALFVNYTTTQKAYVSSDLTTKNRFLNVSTKTVYTPYTNYIEEISETGGTIKKWQEDQDPVNGLFNTSITTKSDGKFIKSQVVPAYSVKKPDGTLAYSTMGSKVVNINNKNMLTQDAMSITSVKIGNVWKTTDANITTWNDTWAYRNETTGSDATESSKKVWRKHKTFAWKEALNADGAYSTTLTKDNTQFNWGLGTPVSDKWQKLSEITRYTRWSMPIETKDINGNLASTKMADNDTKVLVSGNARYTEMYFSGAEYVKSGNLFDGEVKGASFRSDDVAHTGKYAVKANNITDKVFEVNGSTGSSDYYNTTSYTSTFRPGKYKISVWALEEGNPVQNAKLTVNGAEIRVSESVKAGCWRQLNYYFDLPANYSINNIAITAKSINGKNYFDDFRMSPIASNINSYVYNEITDELSYSLDANNIGSAFLYDNAGRLIANYAEIIDTPVQQGGFKITSQFKQNYKTVNSGSLSINPVIDNCYTLPEPLDASIENNCSFIDDGFVYKRKYKINATGGSGNYSYEYKWLKNFNTNTYTNYFSCTSDVVIPYTVQNCLSPNEFKKVWKLVVKVTDLVTGESIIRDYTYTGSTCYDSNDYPLFHENIAMISKEYCSNECSPNYLAFNVHLINPTMAGNFKLEYAHSSSLDQNMINNLNWIDVTNVDGRFCLEPDIVMGNCIEFYQWLHVRATNLDTGEVYTTIGLSFSVCNLSNFNPNDRPVSPENYLMKYGEAVFLFNSDGKIIEVHSAK